VRVRFQLSRTLLLPPPQPGAAAGTDTVAGPAALPAERRFRVDGTFQEVSRYLRTFDALQVGPYMYAKPCSAVTRRDDPLVTPPWQGVAWVLRQPVPGAPLLGRDEGRTLRDLGIVKDTRLTLEPPPGPPLGPGGLEAVAGPA
jgi:hypothetical protein